MEKREELLNALRIIRNFCRDRVRNGADCKNCHLRTKNGHLCYLTKNTPNNWELKRDAEDIWRAFDD